MVDRNVVVNSKEELLEFLISRGMEEDKVIKLLGPDTEYDLPDVYSLGPTALERITGISGKRFKRAFAWIKMGEGEVSEEGSDSIPAEDDTEVVAEIAQEEKKEMEMGFIWTSPDSDSVEEAITILNEKKKMIWPCKFYVNLKRFDLPIEGFIYIKSDTVSYKASISHIETDKEPLPAHKEKALIPKRLLETVPEGTALAYLTLDSIEALPKGLPLRSFTTVNNTPVKSARQYTLIWVEEFDELLKKESEPISIESKKEDKPKKKIIEEISVEQFKPLRSELIVGLLKKAKVEFPQ